MADDESEGFGREVCASALFVSRSSRRTVVTHKLTRMRRKLSMFFFYLNNLVGTSNITGAPAWSQ